MSANGTLRAVREDLAVQRTNRTKTDQSKIAAGPGTEQAKHAQTYSYSIYMYGSYLLLAVGLTISDIQAIEARQAETGRTIANGDFRFNTEF